MSKTIILFSVLLASSAAYAAPDKTVFDADAIRREQLIKDLSSPPPSALNICRRC